MALCLRCELVPLFNPSCAAMEVCGYTGESDRTDEIEGAPCVVGCAPSRSAVANSGTAEALDLRHGLSPIAAAMWLAMFPKAAGANANAAKAVGRSLPRDAFSLLPWNEKQSRARHKRRWPQAGRLDQQSNATYRKQSCRQRERSAWSSRSRGSSFSWIGGRGRHGLGQPREALAKVSVPRGSKRGEWAAPCGRNAAPGRASSRRVCQRADG